VWIYDGQRLPSDRQSAGAGASLTLELGAALARRLRQAALARGRQPEELALALLARGLDRAARQALAAEALQSLTPRQQQVAWLIARGYTNHQIALDLVVSPETVKTHVRNVLDKFEAGSKAELRVLLLDLGVRWWQAEPDPPPAEPPHRPDRG
jgi:DNA-binding NarL/FixJ family response regulator